jgi:hypothetical protein
MIMDCLGSGMDIRLYEMSRIRVTRMRVSKVELGRRIGRWIGERRVDGSRVGGSRVGGRRGGRGRIYVLVDWSIYI